MVSKAVIFALAATPLVAAHGKPVVLTGNLGGNGTALANMGGVVPLTGPNRKTEVDTTVFKSRNIMTDGLGKTTGNGKVQVADIDAANQMSGGTLPQVSSTGGSISGTFHVVTTDGAGPLRAVLDPTGTGSFSNGVELTATQQVPGNGGNMRPNGSVPGKKNNARDILERAIFKRAANVNKDFPMAFSVPDGTTCTGTSGNLQNVCLVKIANNNGAGPFGGVMAIQIPPNGAAAGGAAAKREVAFQS
ncbi:cas1 appressorium specific protein [Colletotrichum truncatum]|uniref:Cas1 appressorium specific protein n=1 Tax=Colletotrichum truncatum TaxID=5467 RepID=A0ACC3Z6G4_COLTU|nr:cas1 appressorium specific protein [Colletotrichum truncatum]KAF6788052.1 cas1 appressorium specific protein [Colletotrichum truncatum]